VRERAVRLKRGTVVAAGSVVMMLALAGCAKDGPGTAASGGGTDCARNAAPTGAGPVTTSDVVGTKADASSLKVGIVFDVGGRGDGAFNDAAIAGIELARTELKLSRVKEQSAAAGETVAARTQRLRQLAEEGYNPVMAVGFVYAEPMTAVAKDHPNVRFGLVDGFVPGVTNITPLVFAEHEGSFLAGVIAAYKTKKCHVGFVGGVDIPLIRRFYAGFEQGAKAVAPGIVIEKRYLTPAGDTSGFNDPAKGTEAARGQLDSGVDVIFHASGASGKGVFSAVRSSGAMAIGVDADQYNQPSVAEYKDVIISSMLKKVDRAVYDFVNSVAKNDLGSIPKVFDLKVDGVGYSTSGGRIDDIRTYVDAYRGEIITGKRKVDDTVG
jgi:basic membrane protein A